VIYGFLLVLHLIICVTLILVVLLQSGKGGGLAGAFGGMGGAGQSLFGGRGAATFLSKATTVLGIAFMTTSLILALMSGSHNAPRSVIREGQQVNPATQPPQTTQPLQIPGGGAEGLPPVGGEMQAPATGGQEGEATPPSGQQPAPSPQTGQQPAPGDQGSPPNDNAPGGN
jgi:preprotein translocase subunit SecG